MPLPAIFFLIAAVLPLASFLLLMFLGQRLGRPIAGWVATALVAGSFAMGLAGMIAWFNGGQIAGVAWGPGQNPIDLSFKWIGLGPGIAPAHPGFLDWHIYLDSLTVAMVNMITLVMLAAHVFSIGSMRDEKHFPRYFMFMALLGFVMLALVLAGSLLEVFIFWELLSLCDYLLIGFSGENPRARRAALRAFIMNRLGDVGFLIGLGLIFSRLGNFGLLEVNRLLPAAVSPGMLTGIGVSLFCAAVGRSALFPLHVWLADATEAPMPASAVLHAAAGVSVGVYLMARVFPVLTSDARLFIAILGAVTLVMGALIAMAQSNIKRLLAYAVVSQMGLMMMALGIGSWVGAVFHLFTQAFFMALLFLCAAVVIRAAGTEDLSRLGGLMRKLPITAAAFGVGVLALSGAPFFSGYFSRQMILTHAAAWGMLAGQNGASRLNWAFFVLPLITGALTAFYMARCWMLIFWGRARDPSVPAAPHERAMLFFPLGFLAGVSLLGGSRVMDIRRIVAQSPVETVNYCNADFPAGAGSWGGFAQAWPGDNGAGTADESLLAAGGRLAGASGPISAALGLLAGVAMYSHGYSAAKKILRFAPLRVVQGWLERGMDFDVMYEHVFVAMILAGAQGVRLIDRYVLEGPVRIAGLYRRRK